MIYFAEKKTIPSSVSTNRSSPITDGSFPEDSRIGVDSAELESPTQHSTDLYGQFASDQRNLHRRLGSLEQQLSRVSMRLEKLEKLMGTVITLLVDADGADS